MLATMIPIRAPNRMLPQLERSRSVTKPHTAMPANRPAAPANAPTIEPVVYTEKMKANVEAGDARVEGEHQRRDGRRDPLDQERQAEHQPELDGEEDPDGRRMVVGVPPATSAVALRYAATPVVSPSARNVRAEDLTKVGPLG